MKVTYVDHCGSDLSVVNSARVSFNKRSDWVYCAGDYCDDRCCSSGVECPTLSKDDLKLVSYLAREGHHSPFNHAFITMHVKAPIFVARQLVKHKFMPWNEVSRRYVDDEPEFYFPEFWREKSEDKKQGSGKDYYTQDVEFLDDGPYFTSRDCISLNLELYQKMLEKGVCPEQARMVLPLNTYTEWYWSGTLGAWMDMYNLRSKEDTQYETRQVALQAGEILRELFPVSFREYTK